MVERQNRRRSRRYDVQSLRLPVALLGADGLSVAGTLIDLARHGCAASVAPGLERCHPRDARLTLTLTLPTCDIPPEPQRIDVAAVVVAHDRWTEGRARVRLRFEPKDPVERLHLVRRIYAFVRQHDLSSN